MLSKLEQAVEKISESTRDISQILIRHEERIDRASEANAAIIQLMNKTESDLKDKIDKDVKELKIQADNNSTAIKDLERNKWIWVGAVAVISLLLGQIRILDYFHPPKQFPHQFNAEHVRSL